ERKLSDARTRCLSLAVGSGIEKQLQPWQACRGPATAARDARRLRRRPASATLQAMDEHPFRMLSRKEFDGLSLEEKLAYLDLELLSASSGGGLRRGGRPPPQGPPATRRLL